MSKDASFCAAVFSCHTCNIECAEGRHAKLIYIREELSLGLGPDMAEYQAWHNLRNGCRCRVISWRRAREAPHESDMYGTGSSDIDWIPMVALFAVPTYHQENGTM